MASIYNLFLRFLIFPLTSLISFRGAVGSVAATDVDYREALQGPLYDLIRRQLHSHNKPATSLEDFDEEIFKGHKTDAISKNHIMKARTSVPEIIEEDTERRRSDADVNNIITNVSSENLVLDEHWASSKEKASISPEVEHALGILDQAITIVQGKNFCKSSIVDCLSFSELLAKVSLIKNGDVPENVNKLKLTNKREGSPPTDDHRHSNLSSSILEAAHNEAATLSSQKEVSSVSVSSQLVQSKIIHPSKASVKVTQPLALDIHSISKVCDEDSVKAIRFYNSRHPFSGKKKNKKTKKKTGKNLCLFCLSPSFFQD